MSRTKARKQPLSATLIESSLTWLIGLKDKDSWLLRRRTLLRSLAVLPLWRRHVPKTAQAASRPHIIVILLDDLDAASVAAMPITQERLFSRGVTVSQFFATTPLCAPSRATLLTGL